MVAGVFVGRSFVFLQGLETSEGGGGDRRECCSCTLQGVGLTEGHDRGQCKELYVTTVWLALWSCSKPKSVEVVFSFAEREFAQPKRITWMIAMDGVKCDSVTGCVLLRNTASERNKQRKR